MTCSFRTFRLERFDPLALFVHFCPEGPGFLDSQAPNERTGRYSIVPLRRRESYRLDDEGLVRIAGGRSVSLPGDPFSALAGILRDRLPGHRLPGPFPGGYFGYFGYDLAGRIETFARRADRDLPVPQLWLDWVDLTVVYDHRTQIATLCSLEGTDHLPALEREIRRAVETPLPSIGPAQGRTPSACLSPARFREMVEVAREYIAAGDIYQANLSCRFDGEWRGGSAGLYDRLRRVNPSPFACLLRSPGVEIVSCSPERLVSLHGGVAETRPIAGTRPRGVAAPEDARLGRELLAHPKERAEHIMLLDLERNDLGKVCRPGSVEVDELMALERYSHVTHIVSNVRGELLPDLGPFDLLRATFPGGTITGVPKKRCMEIIEELEPTGRGVYTGSAGYISVTGDMDLNILIRTFQRCDGHLSYQAGAGIVADSVPEQEWQECLAKGKALRKCLGDLS